MIYEIINPSDPYTIEANDHAVAAVACFILGEGAYAFDPVDGTKEKRVPIFLLGGSDEWCQTTFGLDADGLSQDVLKTRKPELIACLESCLIGKPSAREEFDEACDGLDDTAKKAMLKALHHNKLRSSINDIGGRAYRWADHLRALPSVGGA